MYFEHSFQINLTRRRTPVLLQTYLPSGLFVIVSWISFIVPPEVVPGKIKQAALSHKSCLNRLETGKKVNCCKTRFGLEQFL